MGRPEMVVKRSFRSADLVFASDMIFSNNGRSPFRQESESRIDYARGKQALPTKTQDPATACARGGTTSPRKTRKEPRPPGPWRRASGRRRGSRRGKQH